MKSTPVKEMGAAIMNMAAAQAGKSTGTGDFQKIWNNQMNKGVQDSRETQDSQKPQGVKDVQDSQGTKDSQITQDGQNTAETQNVSDEQKAETKTEDNAQLKSEETGSPEEQPVRKEETGPVKELSPAEEMSSEELEQAMALLVSAAMDLMQQIADAFGISMEELQTVMDDLGLKPMELLDASVLGDLVLQLGGAEDVSALLMDETLYGNYRMLMEQLKGVLQEKAGELEMDPEALVRFVKEGLSDEAVPEEETEVRRDFEPVVMEGPETAAEGTEGTLQKLQDTRNASDQNGGQAGSNGKASEGKSDKGEYHNILIQNIRTDQFQPGNIQTEAVLQDSPWTAQTRDIMNQIMDYMKLQLSPDTTSLEMQLHPASLGTLQVQIASKGGIVTANFITQNEAVKAALESQMVELKESFEQQGVKVEAIEVTVQTHAFERNLEQGRGRNQQEPEKKNRVRRINLGDVSAADTMDEEDKLTAEMMAADGSTVNYTA